MKYLLAIAHRSGKQMTEKIRPILERCNEYADADQALDGGHRLPPGARCQAMAILYLYTILLYRFKIRKFLGLAVPLAGAGASAVAVAVAVGGLAGSPRDGDHAEQCGQRNG